MANCTGVQVANADKSDMRKNRGEWTSTVCETVAVPESATVGSNSTLSAISMFHILTGFSRQSPPAWVKINSWNYSQAMWPSNRLQPYAGVRTSYACALL